MKIHFFASPVIDFLKLYQFYNGLINLLYLCNHRYLFTFATVNFIRMIYQGKTLFVNNRFLPLSLCPAFKGANVYEVVRAIDGKVLFWNDHYARLIASINALKPDFDFSGFDFPSIIRKLLKRNNENNINVRINVFLGETTDVVLGLIPSYYPDEAMYHNGVKTVTLQAERSNPVVKAVQPALKELVAKTISNAGAYEVLLLNKNGFLTEGSRSNLFLIRGKDIFTAPSNLVLSGVTRAKIFELCQTEDIKIIEKAIKLCDLNTFDACFISGTSPKVLPVCCINEVVYQTKNPILQIVTDRFNLLIKNALY